VKTFSEDLLHLKTFSEYLFPETFSSETLDLAPRILFQNVPFGARFQNHPFVLECSFRLAPS